MTIPRPLTIRLGSPGAEPYKSIDLVEWHNIPPFAILTGVNGSGKTQLLQALAFKLANIKDPAHAALQAMPLIIDGDEIGADSFAYLPNVVQFRPNTLSISNISEQKKAFMQQLFDSQTGSPSPIDDATIH